MQQYYPIVTVLSNNIQYYPIYNNFYPIIIQQCYPIITVLSNIQ